MTDRITPRDLAQMKADSGSWTSYDVLRLIREVELLTEERDRAQADYLRRHNEAVDRFEEIQKLRAALRDGPRMMLQYGKALHLKSVGLTDEAERLRAECLAWHKQARTALENE